MLYFKINLFLGIASWMRIIQPLSNSVLKSWPNESKTSYSNPCCLYEFHREKKCLGKESVKTLWQYSFRAQRNQSILYRLPHQWLVNVKWKWTMYEVGLWLIRGCESTLVAMAVVLRPLQFSCLHCVCVSLWLQVNQVML